MVLYDGGLLWWSGGFAALLGLDALCLLCDFRLYIQARASRSGALCDGYLDGDRSLLCNRVDLCL